MGFFRECTETEKVNIVLTTGIADANKENAEKKNTEVVENILAPFMDFVENMDFGDGIFEEDMYVFATDVSLTNTVHCMFELIYIDCIGPDRVNPPEYDIEQDFDPEEIINSFRSASVPGFRLIDYDIKVKAS